MILSTIKTAANQRLLALWGPFKAKQEAYRARHGHYFQGLALSNAVPDDGALVPVDTSKAAGDQNDWTPAVMGGTMKDPIVITPRTAIPHSWAFFGAGADLPLNIEARFVCNVYEGPAGVHGYYLTATLSKGGRSYSRTAHVEMGVEKTTGSWSVAP